MHSWWPREAAQCNAVNPSLSMHVTDAPALTKVMMASVLPVFQKIKSLESFHLQSFFLMLNFSDIGTNILMEVLAIAI